MRDRLMEMQEISRMEEGGSGSRKNKRIHSEPLLKNGAFENFLSVVQSMRHVLKTLSEDRETIKLMQNDILKNGPDVEKTRELNSQVQQFITKAKIVRGEVVKMHEELAHYPNRNVGTSRARHEQVRGLTTALEAMMINFNEEQINYKERAARKIVDYFKLQNVEINEEQVDEAIESGNIMSLTKNVHLGVEQRKMLYEDVKSRASEIQNVEKQIREIAELFHDMHLMVVRQGETIDRIETSVINAEDHVMSAEKNVKSAVEMRKRNRKMKILVVIGLIILVLLGLFVFKSLLCFYLPIC